MRMASQLHLKPDKEKPLLHRHPWIFSGAVAQADADCQDGGIVDVCAADGTVLARALYNSRSQIVGRVLTLADEPIDDAFFRRRLAAAVGLRASLGLRVADSAGAPTTAFRLVNAESDGLPGLIVDVYAGWLVVQVLTLGLAQRLPEIVAALCELVPAQGVFERSDADIRRKEGMEPQVGVLRGETPPDTVEVRENGLRFLVDVKRGQKTGFFLDQRENRRLAAQFMAGANSAGAAAPVEILNAFCYTGGFGVYAAAACPGARVLNLDASADALVMARRNFELNGLAGAGEYLDGDVFVELRKFRDRARQFDAIILDPPKFAQSQGQLDGACRGYKDLNILAIKLLRPGGLLFTFSCSGLMTPDLFQKVLAGAATDARRDVQILARLGPGPDHPVALAFPEGEYLKGLVLRCV